jgi:hypothetical protein
MRKDLPAPPSLVKTLGPSIILIGLALGSGELILWPYLAANYGLGLIWGAFLGITFQYVLNMEIMRYTLYKGESVFLGFKNISKVLPVWFILATFIPWGIPGFSSAAAEIIARLLNIDFSIFIAIGVLLVAGVLLSSGRFLYNTIENLQKWVILIGVPFIFLLTLFLTNLNDWNVYINGIFGRGEGYFLMPAGVSIAAFLGAFAYSGAGGTLNLAQSYYVKEKGLGMGKHAAKISSLFSSKSKALPLEGAKFKDNSINRKVWNKLWWTVNVEHFLVFWTLGFVTISILSVLAYSLLYGKNVTSGLSFIFAESEQIALITRPFFGTLFLLISLVMLFSTQVGVLESTSRIVSENALLIKHKKGQKIDLSKAFYIALWGQIVLGSLIFFMGVTEPRLLLTLGAVLNALAMAVSIPLIFYLNKKSLRSYYQPTTWRKVLLFLSFLFFAFFLTITVRDNFLTL